eukprot:TRINITY_DN7539_c0_g1_i1.p1 TRINITY_DN7539_c0_g1~~TRINITY_DN7539_c0_g1_i1.p1  ORF type:complete len:176 (+),score=30.15 TRINITY_DN7539_c0_g1_i1:205-732(+)
MLNDLVLDCSGNNDSNFCLDQSWSFKQVIGQKDQFSSISDEKPVDYDIFCMELIELSVLSQRYRGVEFPASSQISNTLSPFYLRAGIEGSLEHIVDSIWPKDIFPRFTLNNNDIEEMIEDYINEVEYDHRDDLLGIISKLNGLNLQFSPEIDLELFMLIGKTKSNAIYGFYTVIV